MAPWQVWLYIAAVLIPLGVFTLELVFGRFLGRLNAYLSTAAIATSFVLSSIGFVAYLAANPAMRTTHHEEHREIVQGPEAAATPGHGSEAPGEAHAGPVAWTARFNWVIVGAGLGGTDVPALEIPLGIYIDNLAALMFVMVSLIATLIHVYSMAYMRDDPRYPRFFLYLSLFCFSMLGLVASATLFMVFVFWELVGICSYLLIGFWYEEKANADAANKAFIVNRVGDIGMLVGLGVLWASLGTFDIAEINTTLRGADGALHVVEGPGGTPTAELRQRDTGAPVIHEATGAVRSIPVWLLAVAGLGVFAGCVGKSAQFPLHVWLPDAMAGPTPVSALIHAATMVAAGVYLVGRFFPLFTEGVLLTIAYSGAITLFIGATIALVQTDYKKVLAYSTVSQLGYMMLGLGVGGWAAGLFHLLTHAFFKALLFLGAGSIYHAVHTYEMPVLGGLRKKMPITAATMLIGTLSISGVPFFSGFYSKDAILGSALAFVTGAGNLAAQPQHFLLFLLPAVGALLTAFYMFRLWFLIFDGEPRGYPAPPVAETVQGLGAAPHPDDHAAGPGSSQAHAHEHPHHANPVEHAHESEPMITGPLVVLAVFAVFVGWPITGGLPFFGIDPFLEHWLAVGAPLGAFELGGAKWWAMGASVLIGAVGIASAAGYYSRWRIFRADVAARRFGPAYTFLKRKWYFDELYDAVFVRPTLGLARAAAGFDRYVIDGLIDGIARWTAGLSRLGGRFDLRVVDGLVNALAALTYILGDWGRAIQTGRLRSYLMVLAIGLVLLFVGAFRWIQY